MKGRVGGGHYLRGTPSELLVCFPSRAHLTLMPKPICSPSRPIDISCHPSTRPVPNRSRANPLSRAKMVKHIIPEMDEEPMSPKVSCAGKIKVRSKSQPICPGWHSTKKKQSWLEAIGLKRDILQFFTARLRFNMSCLGSTVTYTSDEEEEEVSSTQSGSVLSKWFTTLDEESKDRYLRDEERELSAMIDQLATAPPANPLFLMRCRSAPAKANEWFEGGEEEEGGREMTMTSAKRLREEGKEKDRLVLMSYAPDFFEASMDIVKETWVGGAIDPLARCPSWKR